MNMGSLLDRALQFAAGTDVLRILFDASLKTAVLLGLAALAVRSLRHTGAAVRHLVWSLALSAALVMPLLSALLPSWELAFVPRLVPQAALPSPARNATQMAVLQTFASVALPKPHEVNPIEANAPATPSPQVTPSSNLTTVPAGASGASLAANWRLWVLLAWTAGVLAVVVRLGLGIGGIWMLCRAAGVETSGALPGLAQSLAREIGLRRRITLLRARGPAMPMTWGFLRPVVLLPADAGEWPAERRRAVLLHELAHVKRHDCAMQFLGQIACGLYWFNPLVWIAAAQLRLERERACDDQVLRSGSKASDYATQLLEMSRSLRPMAARLAPTVAMAQPSQLSVRLLAILDDKRRRTVPTRKLAVLAWIAVLCISVPLAAIGPKVPQQTGSAAPAPASQSEPESVSAPQPLSPPAAVSRAQTAQTAQAAQAAGESAPAFSIGAAADTRVAGSSHAHVSTHTDVSGKGRTAASIQDDDGHLKMMVRGDGVNLKVDAEGKIDFNDDQTDIVKISSDGYFELEDKGADPKRRLELRPQASGGVERQYWVDGDARPYDTEAQQWFAQSLATLFRRTGYGAEARAKNILARDGVDGLMREVHEIQSDYSRRQYYAVLLQMDNLDGATIQRLVQQAGDDIESDYELAELLVQVSNGRLLDDATCAAFVQAAGTVDSDYERHRVLSAMLKKGPASPAVTTALLKVASGIESDYESAELLIEVLKVQPASQPLGVEFLNAADNLGSDYEHRRVLATLLERRNVGTPVLLSVLKSAPTIHSEYERAELLVQLASQHGVDAETRQPFLDAARTIRSEYERGRVLSVASEHGL